MRFLCSQEARRSKDLEEKWAICMKEGGNYPLPHQAREGCEFHCAKSEVSISRMHVCE